MIWYLNLQLKDEKVTFTIIGEKLQVKISEHAWTAPP